VPEGVIRTKAERIAKLGQRHRNRMARAGEADRHVAAAMPKHLVSPAYNKITLSLVPQLTINLVFWKARYGQDAKSLNGFLLWDMMLGFVTVSCCHFFQGKLERTGGYGWLLKLYVSRLSFSRAMNRIFRITLA
jgi:hypothetical protein